MEKTAEAATTLLAAQPAISKDALFEHLLGHRKLTRKVIEAFPEDKLFTHNLGGMRTFSKMVAELISIAGPSLRGMVTGVWEELNEEIDFGGSKETMLKHWDEATEEINLYWPQLPESRFTESIVAFGLYEGTIYSTILYFIDNEIHHRSQGYVYLRSLGIEPPAFWDR